VVYLKVVRSPCRPPLRAVFHFFWGGTDAI
jgi:hypothetical protein